MVERLADVIELPEVKLVIELDDAVRDPEGIRSSFVLTDEVRASLEVILGRVGSGGGCGVFVKGNFGSGKSHFLSYLYLLLRQGEPAPEVAPAAPPRPNLNVVSISLVKYPASRLLEDIVLSALGRGGGPPADREEAFRGLLGEGIVLIIDELSEFLRAKPSPAAFNEDIRFLQFMGEFAFHHPLWVVASLQEWIEETGHISSSMFNRIKDRYPVRLALTASHIEDIIDRRIVVKKPGAGAVIEEVFAGLRRHYPQLPLKVEEFRRTYPLHPFTVRMLAGLTPLFSQHRGVIQFVTAEARRALQGPPDALITPEAIFDHFEDRIREIPELSRLARTVYDYYRTHVEEIFTDARRRETALAVIKIMILTEISPLEKRRTDREIAEMLLRRISTLREGINYDFVREGVLEPLAAHQMYVIRSRDVYYIDPQVDEGIKLKGKIKAAREKLADRRRLFAEVCARLDLPYLPLREIAQGKKCKFVWQNTLRECVVFLQQQERWKREDIQRAVENLSTSLDGYLVLFSPFTEDREKALGSLKGVSSPFLASLLFWAPRDPRGEETAFLEELIARHQLAGEFPELGAALAAEEPRLREIVRDLYFSGRIIGGSGRVEENLENVGYLPLEKLLAHLFDAPLAELHPGHYAIMPRIEYSSSYHLDALFGGFIRRGKITMEEAEKRGLAPYIQGLLEPLGIVRKKGGSFFLSLDPENEIVSYFLDLVSREESMAEIRRALRKGRWGMGESQAILLVASFIVTGHAVPMREGREMDLNALTQLQFGEITGLRPGRVLTPELLGYLHHGRFMWGEVEGAPTPLTQKAMWSQAVETTRKVRHLLDETGRLAERYGGYAVLKKLNLDRAVLGRLALFFGSIVLSAPASEGLEKVLSYLKENPLLGGDVEYLEGVHRFLSEQFQAANRCFLYLSDPALETAGELDESRRAAAARLEELLASPGKDFRDAGEAWERFFEKYTGAYAEAHERYYADPAFEARKEAVECEACRLLKNISQAAGSVTFDGDWWEVKRDMDGLPERCRRDLSHELFQGPLCGCGFRMGDEPPAAKVDFAQRCAQGVTGFLVQLHAPENRERLEAYALGLADAGRAETAGTIRALIDLNPETVSLSLLPPLLTDECLGEIGRALGGRWKEREVRVEELVGKIRGRRLRYGRLVEIFRGWAGEDEETILWVRGGEDAAAERLGKELARYGPPGERLGKELGALAEGCGPEEIGERLEKEGWIERIKWGSFSTDQVIGFLDAETLPVLRRRLRTELFHRLREGNVREDLPGAAGDEHAADLLRALKLLGEEGKHRGGALFAKVAAPLSLLLEKMRWDNGREDLFDGFVLEGIGGRLEGMLKGFGGGSGGVEGLGGADALAEKIGSVLVVLDGLRFDLWCLLKEELRRRGWTADDDAFAVRAPSTTAGFREALGIGEADSGSIGGRSCAMLRWAEKGGGARKLRSFLKGGADIKVLHFNFIDVKAHASSIDLYPLFLAVRDEFVSGVMPLLDGLPPFNLASDHGFVDTGRLKERYAHGGSSAWETVLPFAAVRRPSFI